MSRPAISCARRKHETASSYCSRKRECTIASRKLCDPSTAVYQDGRGSDPMIEVGIVTPADALYIVPLLLSVGVAGGAGFRNRKLRSWPASPARVSGPAAAAARRNPG